MALNVRAILNVSQIVAKKMIENNRKGSIVNISSQASIAALQDHTAYCASKSAVDSLTRVMALELGPHGIRANTVNPTVIMTDLGRKVWAEPAKSQGMLSKIPMGRIMVRKYKKEGTRNQEMGEESTNLAIDNIIQGRLSYRKAAWLRIRESVEFTIS